METEPIVPPPPPTATKTAMSSKASAFSIASIIGATEDEDEHNSKDADATETAMAPLGESIAYLKALSWQLYGTLHISGHVLLCVRYCFYSCMIS